MGKRKDHAIAAVAALKGEKVPSSSSVAAAPVTKVKPATPTPEQLKRGSFVEEAITDRGVVSKAKAYRRHPRFETLAKDGTITDDQARALRFYRDAWEGTRVSEMRCALDVENRGGGGVPVGLPVGMLSDYRVREAEAALGALVHTVRAIALHDMSFSDLAMERFGAREVDVIAVGKGKVPATSYRRLVPKSGRHREAIKVEFLEGVWRLEAAVRPYLRTGS